MSNFQAIDWNYNFVGLLHHPFWLQRVLALFGTLPTNIWDYFVSLRITDEGLVPEMCIWSMLLSKFDWKWCIHVHLSRSIFLYIIAELQSGDVVKLIDSMLLFFVYSYNDRSKTNHPISSNSHPLVTPNKAMHCLKLGESYKTNGNII